MILSAQKDLLSPADINVVADMVAKPEFRRALHAMLLKYQSEQIAPLKTKSEDENAAAASWRITGAVALATLLTSIGEVTEQKRPDLRQNLRS